MKKFHWSKVTATFAGFALSGSMYANTGEKVSPDNSAINARDKSVVEITADQQSNGTQDISLIKAIRQDLVKDESLSTYAKNIKIISDLGTITLKGPVNNTKEKNRIEKVARKYAGKNAVINQIDIMTPSREGE